MAHGATLIFKGVYKTHRGYDVRSILETGDDWTWFNG